MRATVLFALVAAAAVAVLAAAQSTVGYATADVQGYKRVATAAHGSELFTAIVDGAPYAAEGRPSVVHIKAATPYEQGADLGELQGKAGAAVYGYAVEGVRGAAADTSTNRVRLGAWTSPAS